LNKAKNFYDSLKVSKGPSLGTIFTLVCPYVLLAHYDELDWAESFGIPSHLIRVSVGLEVQDQLWKTLSEALNNFYIPSIYRIETFILFFWIIVSINIYFLNI